jgi:hypothetical protein
MISEKTKQAIHRLFNRIATRMARAEGRPFSFWQ